MKNKLKFGNKVCYRGNVSSLYGRVGEVRRVYCNGLCAVHFINVDCLFCIHESSLHRLLSDRLRSTCEPRV